MSTYVNVVRYHLVQRFNFLILPWAILVFVFGIDIVVLVLTPAGTGHRYVGGLASIFVIGFVLGTQSVSRSLPFGLALGISRRSYYLGTALLAIAFALVVAVLATIGQVVERATNGWGLQMGFFRVPYLLDGPWYLTLLTAFVVLTLLFFYGLWFGLIYRRWNLVGLVSFIAAQITALAIGAAAATWTHGWHQIGHFFKALSAAGLTGILAAAAVALLAGGFTTMRRLTV